MAAAKGRGKKSGGSARKGAAKKSGGAKKTGAKKTGGSKGGARTGGAKKSTAKKSPVASVAGRAKKAVGATRRAATGAAEGAVGTAKKATRGARKVADTLGQAGELLKAGAAVVDTVTEKVQEVTGRRKGGAGGSKGRGRKASAGG